MGGSTAFSFHWAHRPLLVKDPSRSIQWLLGRYKTSVSISAGFWPGAFQNSALSSMNGSMTTFHLSLAIASNNRGHVGIQPATALETAKVRGGLYLEVVPLLAGDFAALTPDALRDVDQFGVLRSFEPGLHQRT